MNHLIYYSRTYVRTLTMDEFIQNEKREKEKKKDYKVRTMLLLDF